MLTSTFKITNIAETLNQISALAHSMTFTAHSERLYISRKDAVMGIINRYEDLAALRPLSPAREKYSQKARELRALLEQAID